MQSCKRMQLCKHRCTCVHTCTVMQTHMHSHANSHATTHSHTSTRTFMRTGMQTSTNAHADTRAHLQSCKDTHTCAWSCTRRCTHKRAPSLADTHTHTCAVTTPHHPPLPCCQGRKMASCTDNVTDARLPAGEGDPARVVTSYVCQSILVPPDVMGYKTAVSSQPVSLADRVVGESWHLGCSGVPLLPPTWSKPLWFDLHPRHPLLWEPGATGTPHFCHRRHHRLHAGWHHLTPRALSPRPP